MAKKQKFHSQSELADYIGVSRVSVGKAIKSGRIPPYLVHTQRNGYKRIKDMEEAAEAYIKNSPPKSITKNEPESAGDNTSETYQKSRSIREAFAARIAKLDYEERLGKLVDASKVKATAFSVGRNVREAMQNIPDRLATQLAAESDPHVIFNLMTEEIDKALSSVADHIKSGGVGGSGGDGS